MDDRGSDAGAREWLREGWAVRYCMLLGWLLCLGSLFVAFEAAELLDGRVPLKRGTIGFVAAGLFMFGGDVGARRFGGEGEGLARYWHGPALRGVPVFVVGLFFLVLGVCLRNQ